MNVGELTTKLGYEVDNRGMEEAKKGLDNYKKALVAVGVGIAAIGAGIAAMGFKAISSAANMEDLTTQFEVMLGSAEKAVALMEKVKDFSEVTPFEPDQVASVTKTLLAFGVEAGDVIDTVKMLGDTSGGSFEKLNGIVLAYGKALTKGKVSSEELNQLAIKGLPIYGTLADKFGVTTGELQDMVSQGKVTSADMKIAFQTMTSSGGMFFKGMEQASQTYNGLLSTFKGTVSLLWAWIGEKLLPTAKTVLKTLIEFVGGPLKTIIQSGWDILLVFYDFFRTTASLIYQSLLPAIHQIQGAFEDAGNSLKEGFMLKVRTLMMVTLTALGSILSLIWQLGKDSGPALSLLGAVLGIIGAVILDVATSFFYVIGLVVDLVRVIWEWRDVAVILGATLAVLFGPAILAQIGAYLLGIQKIAFAYKAFQGWVIATKVALGGQATITGIVLALTQGLEIAVYKAGVAMKTFVMTNPALVAAAAAVASIAWAITRIKNALAEVNASKEMEKLNAAENNIAQHRLYRGNQLKRLNALEAKGQGTSAEAQEIRRVVKMREATIEELVKARDKAFKKQGEDMQMPDFSASLNMAGLNAEASILRQTQHNTKQAVVNNSIQVDVNVPEDDSGLTPLSAQGVGDVMKNVARSAFSIELQKVLVSALG
jgi:tape measure domain-containing protein